MIVGGVAAGIAVAAAATAVAADAAGTVLAAEDGDGTLVTFATGIARTAGALFCATPGEDCSTVNGSRLTLEPPLIGELA